MLIQRALLMQSRSNALFDLLTSKRFLASRNGLTTSQKNNINKIYFLKKKKK